MLFLRYTWFDEEEVQFHCLCICRQLSIFPINSVRICPIKLKVGVLYHMNNTFQNTAFQIPVDVP